MPLTYKKNAASTLQAAYSGEVRIGYVEQSNEHRWLWSLNTIQPKGGRASGICETEQQAKITLGNAWVAWVQAAELTFLGPTAQIAKHIKAHVEGRGNDG